MADTLNGNVTQTLIQIHLDAIATNRRVTNLQVFDNILFLVRDTARSNDRVFQQFKADFSTQTIGNVSFLKNIVH